MCVTVSKKKKTRRNQRGLVEYNRTRPPMRRFPGAKNPRGNTGVRAAGGMFGGLTSVLARECRSVVTGRMTGALFAGESNRLIA